MWDSAVNRLMINTTSEWGKQYWDRPCPRNSTLEKHLNRLWNNLHGVAASMVDALKHAGASIEPSKLPEIYHEDARSKGYESDDGSSPWDYPVNRALDEMIFGLHCLGMQGGNETQKLLVQIDKLLEKLVDTEEE